MQFQNIKAVSKLNVFNYILLFFFFKFVFGKMAIWQLFFKLKKMIKIKIHVYLRR